MCELLTGDHFKVGADLDKVGSDNKGAATPLIGIEPEREPYTGMPPGYFDYENPNSGLDGRVSWKPNPSGSMGASPGGKDYYYGVAMNFGPDQWWE